MMHAQPTNPNMPQPPQGPGGEDTATVTVETRFGAITFGRTNIVTFPHGLIGMPQNRRFGLSPIPDPRMGQFMLLQSLEDFGLSFLVLPMQPGPNAVSAEDAKEACAALAIPEEDADFFTVVTLRKAEQGLTVTVNLRAPIVVDSKSRIARQHVLANPSYPIRHNL
jgi:flagellar assembly factor FliW